MISWTRFDSFKSDRIHHEVHFGNYGPIGIHKDDKTGYALCYSQTRKVVEGDRDEQNDC